MTKHKAAQYFFLFFLFITLLGTATPTTAQIEDWAYIRPDCDCFEARFPIEHTIQEKKLRIDEKTVLFMGDYTANIKENGKDKTYMIKIEQKMGGNLSGNMIAFALTTDSARYKKMAETLGGKVMSEKDLVYNGFRGKEIYINYKKDGKNMGLRVKILFTNVTRIYLVSNGPAETSYSFRSKNFFDNIDLFDDKPEIPGNLMDEWKIHTSPKKLFSMISPEKGNAYVESDPVFSIKAINTEIPHIKNIESSSLTFIDPILKYKLIHTIKSYISEKPPTQSEIKNILLKDNIEKYVPDPSPDTLGIDITTIGDRNIITARAGVPATTAYPSVNFVLLEAHYEGNFIVIQELAGTNNYVLSPLGFSMIAGFNFHPDKYDPTGTSETISDATAEEKEAIKNNSTKIIAIKDSSPKKIEPKTKPEEKKPKAKAP